MSPRKNTPHAVKVPRMHLNHALAAQHAVSRSHAKVMPTWRFSMAPRWRSPQQSALFQSPFLAWNGDHCTWKATGRDRFEPKSSLISRPIKPRRSQSHIPNCASCRSKSTTADTQWKIPDMCLRGCRIVSM